MAGDIIFPASGGPLPGFELEPLPEPSGQPGLYSRSGLKTITGTRMNPLARKLWYERVPALLKDPAASPVITGAHPQAAQWMEHLGGLDARWRIEQRPPQDWPLSTVIPRVKMSSGFPQWPLGAGTYWVDWESLASSPRSFPDKPWMEEIKSRLPEGSLALLGGIGRFEIRMSMWARRHEIFASPVVRQFDAVVCPDFSYLDDPRPQGLAAERMTQLWVQAGAEQGLNMIPTVSWQNETALRCQLDALGAQYPQVHTVYMDLLAATTRRRPWVMTRTHEIAEHMASLPLRFLISGLDSGWAVRRILEVLPEGNFHLVTLWPWLRTGFNPGTAQMKGDSFRRMIRRYEEWAQGEGLPPALEDPQDPAEYRREMEAEVLRKQQEA